MGILDDGSDTEIPAGSHLQLREGSMRRVYEHMGINDPGAPKEPTAICRLAKSIFADSGSTRRRKHLDYVPRRKAVDGLETRPALAAWAQPTSDGLKEEWS